MYKITASLLSSWNYHLKDKKKASFASLMDAVRGIYEPNMFTKLGHDFEDDVFSGKNRELSLYVKYMKRQVSKKRTIEVDGNVYLISGKLDLYDTDKQRILDLKRIIKKDLKKYDDSAQHLLYFYLEPTATEFIYICAYGPLEMIKGYFVIRKERPPEDELEEAIRTLIRNFIQFLKEKELLETYLMFQKVERN